MIICSMKMPTKQLKTVMDSDIIYYTLYSIYKNIQEPVNSELRLAVLNFLQTFSLNCS